eukprot:2115304-Rhodomonas_salina.1
MSRKYKSVRSQRAINEAVLVSTCIGIAVGEQQLLRWGGGTGSPIVPEKEFSVRVEAICIEYFRSNRVLVNTLYPVTGYWSFGTPAFDSGTAHHTTVITSADLSTSKNSCFGHSLKLLKSRLFEDGNEGVVLKLESKQAPHTRHHGLYFALIAYAHAAAVSRSWSGDTEEESQLE